MKSFLQSLTLWGAIVAIVSRFTGIEMSAGDAQGLVQQFMEAWPLLVGLLADSNAAVKRVTATRFDLRFWQSPVFWSGLVATVMGVLQAMGVNWEGLETLPQKVGGAVTAVGGVLGPVLILIGRAKAKKVLGV